MYHQKWGNLLQKFVRLLKEDKQEVHKVEKELPNTGSEEMDLPLKELALITGAALLARRRTKMKRES